MDNKQFCFIICTNNEMLLNECMEYLSRLYIPDGYTVDALTITEAKSMTSGNNEGMRASEAKYKIYMHQDVFITNRYFLYNLLDIFNMDKRIGLIGMVGYAKISDDAVMWHEKRFGANPLYGSGKYKDTDINSYRYSLSDGITDVKVADGLLLATQYDIEWDEKFDAWDFYDASQCVRFSDAGYRVVVPNQKVPWFVHDDGLYLSVWNYNKYRKLFITKYMNRDDGSKKIAFITCVNDEKYYDEFKWYVEKLIVPEGYSLELIPIRGAASMPEGYNQGMRSTDAKYKIYVHQDVFFINKDYLCDLIKRFEDNPDVGMIGAIGTDELPSDGNCWNAWNIGRTIGFTGYVTSDIDITRVSSLVTGIKAIDGMVMATQYDVKWRDDIGLRWDYYDISQSIEFSKRGLKIAIMCQNEASMIHDCGCSKLTNYESSRKIMLDVYSDAFPTPYKPISHSETYTIGDEIARIQENLFDSGYYDELLESVSNIKDIFNTDVKYMMGFMDIYKAEKEKNECYSFEGIGYAKAKQIMIDMRFLLRRHYYYTNSETGKMLLGYIGENHISETAVSRMALFAFPEDIRNAISGRIVRELSRNN